LPFAGGLLGLAGKVATETVAVRVVGLSTEYAAAFIHFDFDRDHHFRYQPVTNAIGDLRLHLV